MIKTLVLRMLIQWNGLRIWPFDTQRKRVLLEDLSAIALFFKHVHWLPDSSCIPFFFLSVVKMALSPFFVSYTEGKRKTTVRCCILEHLRPGNGGKTGKLRLCKHMEKNELLMHGFFYSYSSFCSKWSSGLWTSDDTVALWRGVFFLEPELDYANIFEWHIKMVN